ncbi:hypothetical protein TNCV_2679881 [Trichonephila clavipes]|nr:hypothetical protein TNCV_2679881 [Trichonephila clavipes]
MPESLVLSEEKKMPTGCDCYEASLMTPNSLSLSLSLSLSESPAVRSAGCKCLPFLLVMKCARLILELLAMRCFGGIPSCEKCWIQVSPVPASD